MIVMELRGLKELLAYARSLGNRIRVPNAPAREAAEYMKDSIDQNFAAQGRPDRWAALAEGTVLQRGSSGPILERTGGMRNANVIKIVGGGFDIRNRSPHAIYHHEGTDRMPMRRFLMFQQPADTDKVAEIYARHFFEV